MIALPHLGASTREAEENCAVMVAEQLRDYLEHGNIRHSVNFPEAVAPRESAYRVAIANANVPNMLGQISTTMAEAGLNIHTMLNKSRGEMAYTLVDVDSPVPPQVVAAIASIDGVLAVRYLAAETADAGTSACAPRTQWQAVVAPNAPPGSRASAARSVQPGRSPSISRPDSDADHRDHHHRQGADHRRQRRGEAEPEQLRHAVGEERC